ncbi:MAG: geranylgeranyl reductase family protein [Nitrososphaera sp.]|uniref:geranylgeranyl reductase family protein n=1 Tax=Nitrososphaera sp. TaxID=1971748 RepID=UPI003D6FB97A
MSDFDVVVAGGSISGLLAAREAARAGLSVAVVEEDAEIGTPEHCGGLVSMEGIRNLGIIPDAIENNRIKKARILSPSNGFEIAAEKQKVVVVDRRELDKQVALQAQRAGAEIRVKCSMRSAVQDGDCYVVKTSEGELKCGYFVDARGVASIINRNREGVLSSAQYEVYAPWIERDTIEVAFDSEKYPGFFAWVIPTGDGQGKVGVAGKGINAASALKSYMDAKGPHSAVRKVYAPIWVSGPVENFASGHTVIVGDAAGQTKPTTAGGIYTCGMGGMMAGKAIANENMSEYQHRWESMFKDEFDKMLLARRLLERLDNRAIDDLFSAIPKDRIEEAASTGDFDFHAAALSKMLSAKSAARMARALFGNEIRRLVDG